MGLAATVVIVSRGGPLTARRARTADRTAGRTSALLHSKTSFGVDFRGAACAGRRLGIQTAKGLSPPMRNLLVPNLLRLSAFVLSCTPAPPAGAQRPGPPQPGQPAATGQTSQSAGQTAPKPSDKPSILPDSNGPV